MINVKNLKDNFSSPKKANLQHKQRASIKQYYRRRNIDALSGDESNVKKVEKKSIPSPESIQESQVKNIS